MSTITSLVGTDGITTADSMTTINTNFSNLNTDKIETSYLDTDTTLAANSDTKIATQKAVKTYVDAGGNVNASETTKGIVEEATDAEVTAGTATGATGAKLFVTPAKLATRLSGGSVTVITTYGTAATDVGSSTTRFDVTNPASTTYRYTFDGTGTDPSFSLANYPVGTGIYFNAQNFTAANNGVFTVTGSGTNYVEVTNASGVVESDKTIGTGFISKGTYWTKPSGLKYALVEVCGGGGGGHGGGAGGNGTTGRATLFGVGSLGVFYGQAGNGCSTVTSGASGGTGIGGDLNIGGGGGSGGAGLGNGGAGCGGSSYFGAGGYAGSGGGQNYGGGGGGGPSTSSGNSGGGGGGAGGYARKIFAASSLATTTPIIVGAGGTSASGGGGGIGVVIVTEYYS